MVLGTGSGEPSSPKQLHRGVGVVVDRYTLYAEWVAVCGNDIVSPRDWIPEGKLVCGPDQGSLVLNELEKALMAELGNLRDEHGELLEGQKQILQGQDEIKDLIRNIPPPYQPPQPEVKKKHRVWPWVVVAAIGLGIAASSGGGGGSHKPNN